MILILKVCAQIVAVHSVVLDGRNKGGACPIYTCPHSHSAARHFYARMSIIVILMYRLQTWLIHLDTIKRETYSC